MKTNRAGATQNILEPRPSRRPPWLWSAVGAAACLVIGITLYYVLAPSAPASRGGDAGPSGGAVAVAGEAEPTREAVAEAPRGEAEAAPASKSASSEVPPGPAPEGMVWIPGGQFWMGSEDPSMSDAKPVHLVTVDGFWIDRTEVTNRQFARFAEETGYLTVAERPLDPKDYPGAPPELLVPGSIVFSPPDHEVSLSNALAWWKYVPGANWRHPEGPDSSLEGREDYPAVHICYEDAVAYTRWANKRLPTEAEWEFAARGGLDRKRYVWGDELTPGGKWMANNWQGRFPRENTSEDGFARLAPVSSYPPNGYGLSDMAGNVWEWCADWYRPDAYMSSSGHNPQGPDSSHDPNEPGIPKRVQRGGSFLCSDLYCTRYLPGARGKGAIDSGQNHVGFRCVLSPERSS